MKGNLFLPDTSAILTMMDNEEGADVIEDILRMVDQVVLPYKPKQEKKGTVG